MSHNYYPSMWSFSGCPMTLVCMTIACRLWQWATSDGHEFLRRRGDDILWWHATNPPLPPIIQFAKLLGLQIFNYSKDSIPMRGAATKDVKMTRLLRRTDLCLSILVATDLRRIFVILRCCWEVKLVCCVCWAQLWIRRGFVTVDCKPYVLFR